MAGHSAHRHGHHHPVAPLRPAGRLAAARRTAARRSRLPVHVFVLTTESKAAAAVRIGAALAVEKRGELAGLLRPCFARTQVWLQAGKYMAALMSDLPERNG